MVKLRVVLLALAAACSGADPAAVPADAGGGEVLVRWNDGDTVNISLEAPGLARWCADGHWLELSAVDTDTGVMLALFPPESLVTGSYPVGRPVRADSLRPRPGATLGVRWFTPGLVAAFRGWEGSVELTAVDRAVSGEQTVSGRLQASAAAAGGAEGSIVVEGEFDRVPVAAADSGCGR